MVSLDRVQDFLAQKRFAFIGVARQRKDFSNALFREFRTRGYQPVPVHLVSDSIDGVACVRRLRDIDPPVDSVLLMTPPAVTEMLVQDCAEAGIKRVWMYRAVGHGSVSAKAVRFCEENGIEVVAGECPFMFFPETAIVHRAHGFIRRIAGTYPE